MMFALVECFSEIKLPKTERLGILPHHQKHVGSFVVPVCRAVLGTLQSTLLDLGISRDCSSFEKVKGNG